MQRRFERAALRARHNPHVILSNATPRGGAYSWKELGSARQGTVEFEVTQLPQWKQLTENA